MITLKLVILYCIFVKSKAEVLNLTSARRILQGNTVGATRPYMVFLRPAPAEVAKHPHWLCAGVILHERYILTSAACIEEVQHFYIISGTSKWLPHPEENDCIKYGKKKAIWKCEPTSYFYDGAEFENINWIANDIAVVKTEDEFNFKRRVKGCEFIPKKIKFNNESIDLEKSRTVGSIAGWGSTDRYSEVVSRRQEEELSNNATDLLETEVVIISKKACKRRWPERYHQIIDESMICTKDDVETEAMHPDCVGEVNCKDLMYSHEEDDVTEDQRRRVRIIDPDTARVHTARRLAVHRRSGHGRQISGGFCENDHGGPLVHGHGTTATVIGVITACQTHPVNKKCFGPFLFTSVYKHRHLISCAIYKEPGRLTMEHSTMEPVRLVYNGDSCRRMLESMNKKMQETTFDWTKHPDGAPKPEKNDDLPAEDPTKNSQVI